MGPNVMSDKPVAYLTTFVGCTPILAVCCLPFFYPAIFAWIAAQFAGLGPLAATGFAIFAGLLIYQHSRRRKENLFKGKKVQVHGKAGATHVAPYPAKIFINGVGVAMAGKKS